MISRLTSYKKATNTPPLNTAQIAPLCLSIKRYLLHQSIRMPKRRQTNYCNLQKTNNSKNASGGVVRDW